MNRERVLNLSFNLKDTNTLMLCIDDLVKNVEGADSKYEIKIIPKDNLLRKKYFAVYIPGILNNLREEYNEIKTKEELHSFLKDEYSLIKYGAKGFKTFIVNGQMHATTKFSLSSCSQKDLEDYIYWLDCNINKYTTADYIEQLIDN